MSTPPSPAKHLAWRGAALSCRLKPDGTRVHGKGSKLRRGAVFHLATMDVTKVNGAIVDRADAGARVARLGEQWMERRRFKMTARSYCSLDGARRIHVPPERGGCAPSAVTLRQVEAWLTAR